MFEILAYPVSVVMKFWHELLSFVFDRDSGVTWALTILLLVVTVRALLVRPAWVQQLHLRKIGRLTPQIQILRVEHHDDERAFKQAVARLKAESKVSVASGCLPLFIQIPVFIGLYQVLLRFNLPGTTFAQAASSSNGAFAAADVRSFLYARLGGLPLSASMTMPADALEAFPGLTRGEIAAVLVPILVIAGVLTFIAMRRSLELSRVQRIALALAQDKDPDAPPEGRAAVFSRRLVAALYAASWMLLFFPLLGGLLFRFPLAIALYWLFNSTWTLVQNEMIKRRLERIEPFADVLEANRRWGRMEDALAQLAAQQEFAESPAGRIGVFVADTRLRDRLADQDIDDAARSRMLAVALAARLGEIDRRERAARLSAAPSPERWPGPEHAPTTVTGREATPGLESDVAAGPVVRAARSVRRLTRGMHAWPRPGHEA